MQSHMAICVGNLVFIIKAAEQSLVTCPQAEEDCLLVSLELVDGINGTFCT